MPGAFPFFRNFLAWMTSLLVGGSDPRCLIKQSTVVYLRSLWSAQLSLALSLSDVNRSPFLSFTSMLVIHRSLFIACSFFLFQGCQIFHVLPLVRSCSKLQLSYLRPVHLLMLFFLQLGYKTHDFPFNFRLLSIAFMHQVTATPLASPACILHPFYTWVVQASNSLEIKNCRLFGNLVIWDIDRDVSTP